MSKTDYNQHLLSAVSNAFTEEPSFIEIEGSEVSFCIQSGPISENGRNGCDAIDLIKYTIGLYKSFNKAVPSRENSLCITKLEEALHWQLARNKDRSKRNVEGTNDE